MDSAIFSPSPTLKILNIDSIVNNLIDKCKETSMLESDGYCNILKHYFLAWKESTRLSNIKGFNSELEYLI